ncbi:MAG: Glu-tRNA(Gln) amidotransferase subunit GatD [Candidatus Nanoarchaeia archaeon]|nr:Glu-tRNA(Gln) amidotransferase subunit GatD [Candidatus Nanoarchaeia archaeon]
MEFKSGERVLLETKKGNFEGLVLPRSEFSDKGYIMLKLDNGYNIGIKLSNIIKSKKLGKAVKLESFQSFKVKHSKNLPDVSMIATGGTIGARVDYTTGGVYMSVKPEELLFTVPELADIINLKKISSPFAIASEDMTPDEWAVLAKETAKELNSGSRGVIITHGTDTLHYTSAALSFMLKNLSKPVAIVGAQRSPDRGSFDGAMNLLCAGHYTKSDLGEVAVVMHAETDDSYCFAIQGTKVRKMHSSMRNAFRPVNDLPLAKIWTDGKMEVVDKNHTKFRDEKVKADVKFEKKVSLLKVFPGSSPEILSHYLESGYKGVVIEATAFGHVPTETLKRKASWIPIIKKASKDMFIGITGQTIYGRTNPYVYRNLRVLANAGAVHLEDMLPETAYVKLGWVMGHEQEHSNIKNMMLTNMAGEITKRTLYSTFLE